MFDREINDLVELLGRDDPRIQSLLWAARNPKMQGAVQNMLRSLSREAGWDPDNLPKFALPRDISESDYPVGTAMSGDVEGEEIGLSQEDLQGGGIGIFGISGTGKTTVAKIILLTFSGKDV